MYDTEPLPADHPFRSLENAVLTPHLGASTEEAQQNVALEIAAAVRAALLEGDFSRAVNAPGVGGERMRRLRPLMELAERMGRIGAALAGERLERVEVRYAGKEEDNLRPLAAAAMIGALSQVVGQRAVNFVNALHLAAGRGIAVERTRLAPRNDYAEYLELRLSGAGEGVRVGGAVLEGAHPRVVRIGDYQVDIVPRGDLVLLRNRDVPGVIGRVGTALAGAGINIGQYHVARLQAGGRGARCHRGGRPAQSGDHRDAPRPARSDRGPAGGTRLTRPCGRGLRQGHSSRDTILRPAPPERPWHESRPRTR